jgi:hypothetical protein
MPPTTNKVWASTPPRDSIEFLTLPSGQTCHARRIGLEAIMTAGLLGEADSLTAMVDRQHVQRVKNKDGSVMETINARTVMKDPKALQSIVLLVDRAAPFIVAEPLVRCHVEELPDGKTRNIPAEDRDKDSVYTDQIPLEDKMFLFEYAVGGTRDVDRFREQSGAAVAGVADVEGIPHKAVRAAGNNRADRRRKH